MLRKFQNSEGQPIYLNLNEADVESITYTQSGSTLIRTSSGKKHVVKETPEDAAKKIRARAAI